MEWHVDCDTCGPFTQIQKVDPTICPRCQSVDIDTSPVMSFIGEEGTQPESEGDGKRVVALRITLKDANGVVVESFTDGIELAIQRAAEFINLHGADPELMGFGAQSGSVYFEPVKQ